MMDLNLSDDEGEKTTPERVEYVMKDVILMIKDIKEHDKLVRYCL